MVCTGLGQEIPVEVTPVIALPAEILANGIRITINNYNKENVSLH